MKIKASFLCNPYHCFTLFLLFFTFLFNACSVSRKWERSLINDPAIRNGHIGISIFEPATGKYWLNYQADKYFIPASNVKLFSLYAGMKLLGDSLPGLYYRIQNDSITEIYPTGDPSFLHKDFMHQPVLAFLKKQKTIVISRNNVVTSYGKGWAWDDHTEKFMAVKSSFPIYGNMFTVTWINKDSLDVFPAYFSKQSQFSGPYPDGFQVSRKFGENKFTFINGNTKKQILPFQSDINTTTELLKDCLQNPSIYFTNYPGYSGSDYLVIYSQPSDSLFKPMMHYSDNFFAEQLLLMVSNEYLGLMNEESMIDTLLKNNFKEVPQKPRWVDGSGLSRYNLFTPQSFVYILNKLKDEFGLERMKAILPKGGEGTLKNYFVSDSSAIFAKTGSMSNNFAISGFLTTQKDKLLIFSVLVNNFPSNPSAVRETIAQYLSGIRKNY